MITPNPPQNVCAYLPHADISGDAMTPPLSFAGAGAGFRRAGYRWVLAAAALAVAVLALTPAAVEAQKLSAPANLTYTGGNRVTWDPVDRALGYDIQWATVGGSYSSNAQILLHSSTMVSISGLTVQTDYMVRVRARIGSAGNQNNSDWSEVRFRVNQKLSAPGNLQHAGGSSVTWDPSDDRAIGYDIQWATVGGSYSSNAERLLHSSTTFSIRGLAFQTEYMVRVRARFGGKNNANNSDWSEVRFRVNLSTPDTLAHTGGGNLTVLTWSPVDRAIGYDIQWATTGTSYSSSRARFLSTPRATVGRFLTAGTEYMVRVRARFGGTNNQGNSDWSDDYIITVPAAVTPVQVQWRGMGVEAKPGLLEVNWQAVSGDNISYEVQWRTDSGTFGTNRQIARPATEVCEASACSVDITNQLGLTPGTSYQVRVRATADNPGQWSDERAGVAQAAGDEASFSINSPSVREDAGTLTFTVTLSQANAGEVMVTYADAGTGTAMVDMDYMALPGGGDTLTFEPGQTSKMITVTVMNDAVIEPDETVILALSAPTGGVLLNTLTGTGTITNDDSRITVPEALDDPIMIRINEQTVTVRANSALPDGGSVDFPLTLAQDVTLFVNSVDATKLVESRQYGLGMKPPARTLVDIEVSPPPADGVKICLPVKDDLRQEADKRQLMLLHYDVDGRNWQAVAGSREEGQQVCASGVTRFSPFAVGYRLFGYGSRDSAFVLAGVARTLATDAVEVIGRRFGATTPSMNGHVTLGGQALQLGSTTADGRQTVAPWRQAANVAIGVARAFGVTLNTGGIGTGVGGSSSSLPSLCNGRLGGVESQGCPLAAGNQWTPGSGLGTQGSGLANFTNITPVSINNVLARSAFELPLSSTGDNGMPAWTLWGRGSASGFSGSPDAGFSMDGTLYSGYVGVDYRPRSSLLFGLAVSHSQGQVDYERAGGQAEVGLKLTSVLPYAHWQPRPGLGVWGLFGAGWGTADYEGTGATPLARRSTDLTSLMGAIGGQQALTTWQGIDLSAKTDAFLSTLRTEAATDLPSARGNAQRIRLLLEGQKDIQVDAVSRLAPRLAFGGRWDNGTAEQGFGAEVNGGLAYTNTASGLSVEAQGRYLLAHEAEEFDDWGASLNVRLDPGQMGQGASLTIAPVWGQAASGVNQLWDNTQMLGQVAGAATQPGTTTPGATSWMPQQLEVALGYGLALPERQALLTPYGGLTLAGPGTSRYRLGSSLAMDSFLNLTLELTHTNQLDQSANQGIATRIDWQW